MTFGPRDAAYVSVVRVTKSNVSTQQTLRYCFLRPGHRIYRWIHVPAVAAPH